MSDSHKLASNILDYHGANVAFLDAHYRGNLLGISKEILDKIEPFPKKEINIFVEGEKKEQTAEQSTKSILPETTEPSKLNKLIKPLIVAGSLLTGGTAGALINEYFNPEIPIVSGKDSEVGIEVR